MAKRPQSAFPACLWTSMCLILKNDNTHFNRTAIFFSVIINFHYQQNNRIHLQFHGRELVRYAQPMVAIYMKYLNKLINSRIISSQGVYGKQWEVYRGDKHKRVCLFNDEDLRLQPSMRVRENAVSKGGPNMTARAFCQWVNETLLPSSNFPPFFPRSV